MDIQQQLELMNKRFAEVKNGMASLRTKVASLQDRLNHRGLERKSTRWANSPLKESITENTYEKAKDFDDNCGGKFQPHRNQSKNDGFQKGR